MDTVLLKPAASPATATKSYHVISILSQANRLTNTPTQISLPFVVDNPKQKNPFNPPRHSLQIAKMPQEVSDIKNVSWSCWMRQLAYFEFNAQETDLFRSSSRFADARMLHVRFLQQLRPKQYMTGAKNENIEGWRTEGIRTSGRETDGKNSCTHKAEQEDLHCQVQGPMPKTPLHPCLEGFREGREVEAITPT